jgi:hypothetical protein
MPALLRKGISEIVIFKRELLYIPSSETVDNLHT